MSHDAEIIAKAIAALQPKTDYLKDYVFPAIMMFCSALLGGLAALRINKTQEIQRITRENFSASIQVFVLAHECLNNLVAIKSNYVDKLTWDEPIYRASAYPTMLAKLDEVKFSSTTLYFIRGMPTANKAVKDAFIWWFKHKLLRMEIKRPPSKQIANTWRNTVRVSSMFDNYNQVMMFIRTRNEISEQVRELMANVDTGSMKTFTELPDVIGKILTGRFVSVTELTIALTDHVIKELYSFMMEFPEIAESNIELSRIRDWGKLPRYENEKALFKKCLQPIIEPNFERVGLYIGCSAEEARMLCTFSDWG
ncbi:TPA: DUF1216 domain-containing protein [Enterobacter asburiae]|nr:DUF1216 domain-containing protein [Enterobacter asburiae]